MSSLPGNLGIPSQPPLGSYPLPSTVLSTPLYANSESSRTGTGPIVEQPAEVPAVDALFLPAQRSLPQLPSPWFAPTFSGSTPNSLAPWPTSAPSSSVQASAPQPRVIPSQFKVLVKAVREGGHGVHDQVYWNDLSQMPCFNHLRKKNTPWFRRYAEAARDAGVVKIGGSKDNRWLQLTV